MEQKKKKNLIGKIIVVVCILAAVAAYFFIPSVNSLMKRITKMFASGDFTVVKDFVASYGGYAAAVSFALMILQSIAAPLPAFLITFANANLFGWWQGAILSWSSAMAGAALCFFISRGLGRDMVERFAGKGALASVETYFEKYGSRTVLVCRLLPFVSFDAVSYFAGLTPIRFTAFFVATGIGQLPATVVYSYVGGMLTGGVKYLVTGLLCIFSLGILGTIFKQLYNDRQAKKAGNAHE